MKMYVFPGDEAQAAEELLTDKPVISRSIDAAAVRFGVIAAVWTAGAFAAAFLAQIS